MQNTPSIAQTNAANNQSIAQLNAQYQAKHASGTGNPMTAMNESAMSKDVSSGNSSSPGSHAGFNPGSQMSQDAMANNNALDSATQYLAFKQMLAKQQQQQKFRKSISEFLASKETTE
jgi:hypothetical protein